MPTFTSRQTRWMGLAGFAGGLLWVITIVSLMQRSRTEAMPAWGRILPVIVSALLLTGLVGLWASYGKRIGRKGAIGISLLIASMASYFLVSALADWLLHDPFKSILGVGFTILPVPGFLLIGLATKGLARAGAFVIVLAVPVGGVLPSLLARFGVTDPSWLLRDSSVNLTWGMYFLLAATWLAAAGYSTYRQGRRAAHEDLV